MTRWPRVSCLGCGSYPATSWRTRGPPGFWPAAETDQGLPVLPFGGDHPKRAYAQWVCQPACVMASGDVHGVFARPFAGGGMAHPSPTGFRLDSHRNKVSQALRNVKEAFSGVAYPCSRGLWVASSSGIPTIRRCLEDGMYARMKELPDSERRVI